MAVDALLALAGTSASPVTDTNSAANTAVNLPGGTPKRGLKARIEYSAASAASGSDTVYWTVSASATSGGTYAVIATGIKDAITLTTTAASGELHIPFFVDASLPWIKLNSVFSSNAHTDTVSYFANIVLNA